MIEQTILTRAEKLRLALTARQQEVEDYQINIDNYTLAIAEIDALPEAERAEQAQFKQHLEALLAGEIREQSKSKIMLSVLQKQVAAP